MDLRFWATLMPKWKKRRTLWKQALQLPHVQTDRWCNQAELFAWAPEIGFQPCSVSLCFPFMDLWFWATLMPKWKKGENFGNRPCSFLSHRPDRSLVQLS